MSTDIKSNNEKTKKNVVTARDGIIVGSIFIIIALFISIILRHVSIISFFTKGQKITQQIIVGLTLGLLISMLLVIYLNKNENIKEGILHLKTLCNSSNKMVILAGLSAGIGEEMLFRGTIQELAGIWITALIFMFAHAQFWAIPPINKGKVIFAAFVFLIGLLLGYIYIKVGLISVIIIHSLIDCSVFIYLKYSLKFTQ